MNPHGVSPDTRLDLKAIAAWTAANAAARRAYYEKPNSVTLKVYNRPGGK